jgi:hypothetical protein
MQRDEIIKFLRSIGIFAQPYIDAGTQQRGLDTAAVLLKRLIAILDGQFVFALLSKNLRAKVERRPQFWIDVECRIYIALCPCDIAISQLLAGLATQIHGRAQVAGGIDNDWHISASNGCAR